MKPIPAVMLLILVAPAARAQQASTATRAPLPDIEFAADVQMDSIRFAASPVRHARMSTSMVARGSSSATTSSATACRGR